MSIRSATVTDGRRAAHANRHNAALFLRNAGLQETIPLRPLSGAYRLFRLVVFPDVATQSPFTAGIGLQKGCQTEETGKGSNRKCSTSRDTRMRLRHDRTDAVDVASDYAKSL